MSHKLTGTFFQGYGGSGCGKRESNAIEMTRRGNTKTQERPHEARQLVRPLSCSGCSAHYIRVRGSMTARLDPRNTDHDRQTIVAAQQRAGQDAAMDGRLRSNGSKAKGGPKRDAVGRFRSWGVRDTCVLIGATRHLGRRKMWLLSHWISQLARPLYSGT